MCVVVSGPLSPPTTPTHSCNPPLFSPDERRLRSLSSPPDTGLQRFSLASASSASSSPSPVRYSPSPLHIRSASRPVSGILYLCSLHLKIKK